MKFDTKKTSVDEIFKDSQFKHLNNLLDDIELEKVELELIDENTSSNKTTEIHQSRDSPPNSDSADIVIKDIELTPAKFKIGQVQVKGKVAKLALGAIFALVLVFLLR